MRHIQVTHLPKEKRRREICKDSCLRQLRLLCSIAVSLSLLISLAITAYTQCLGYRKDISYFAICNQLDASDGKMHVKVNYNAGGEGSPSTAERQAMEAAVAAWNAHSNTSGVVIEVAQPGEDVHLEFAFTTNANLTGGCAAFHNLMSRIHWGADARQQAATLGNVQLATLFMHEIGHFLGLDEITTSQTK